MGSSVSRGVSSSSSSPPSSSSRRRPSGQQSTRNKLSSFFLCGSSTSWQPLESEDNPQGSPINSVENVAPDSSCISMEQSSTIFSSEADCTSSSVETVATSSAYSTTECTPFELARTNREDSTREECLSNASSSNAQKEGASLIFPQNDSTEGNLVENLEITAHSEVSSSGNLAIVPDPLGNHELSANHNSGTATTSETSSIFGNELDHGRLDALHVAMVSIPSSILSSSIAELSSSQARSNRRLYWEALSRRSFSQSNDSPTVVFATGPADDIGSNGRWLLNLSGDLHYDRVFRDPGYLGSRSSRRNGRRWLLRSEISEGLVHGRGDGERQTNFCASGLHPVGTCSCESFFSSEESSTLASISRIIMLAEALFEVLDEIHQQPLSFSLSMLTMPAPEAIVDSFPLKSFKKSDASESRHSDIPQCYICLSEYEEGEKLRVLPCRHEYHVACIDKWLKEINRVCPVCRCNICEDAMPDSVPNTTMV
ncbi:OLC1v1000301C3 [Oldenlandia corymbosa var. corymbosa]|uniref:OLC1v1000301C3 n=1 Tax=Oldenlandia corymbosa var. corymbosa TaxID=529605 RepID=A0AAV1D3I1_OLDCO|nr:OLC1v1000301C3 [Oldenlandia corymbosa var. corymbosa]